MAQKFLVCAAVSLCLICAVPAQAQFAHLVLSSEQGDYIGQGKDWDMWYTPDDPGAFSPQIRRTLGSGEPAELLFVLGNVTGDDTNTFSLLFFGTDQLNLPMQAGIYDNAQRADFAATGHPGLDVSFQNRGCNTLTGSFVVDEVTFGKTGLGEDFIESFSASFIQHCEGMEPTLTGTFSYRAVPEPASMIGLGIGAVSLLVRRRSRRK